ncbi:glycosyltransferase [Methylorubrum populi]|uniref:Glycosyltransferase subfamily 4-like N-terminal domain-containing protein n=1 Tax=Methylorubrum populi TaxID=223967 RepID=A0A833J386_9HYPH|nr:glycosyltransferase [Methylorubrum populi]KAB7783798.1 hypothetical protein F8B43_3721 [Methylorubrum populi]
MKIELQHPIASGDVHNIKVHGVQSKLPTTIDYIAGENILIHISFRPDQQIVVINDRVDGRWGAETRVELPASLMTPVADLKIAFNDSVATISFPEGAPAVFFRETDFSEVTGILSGAYTEFNANGGLTKTAKNGEASRRNAWFGEEQRGRIENIIASDRVYHEATAREPGLITFEVKPYHLPVLKFVVAAPVAAKDIIRVIRVRYWNAKGEVITSTPHGFAAAGYGVSEQRKHVEIRADAHVEELNLVPPYGAIQGEACVSALVGDEAVELAKAPTVAYQSTCHQWHQVGPAEAQPEHSSEKTPIIYSTSAGPFREDVLRLRPHYLSENFGRLGFGVTYIPLSDTINDMNPVPGVAQLRRSDYFLYLQHILNRPFRPGIFICSSLCDSQTFLMSDLLKERGWTILYEVRDDPEGMKAAGAGFGKWYNPHLERRMCRTADAIITVSGPLRDRAIALGAREEAVHVLPNGLEEEAFARVEQNWSEVAMRERATKRTKVGYFGHMFGGRFDIDAVGQAARGMPDIEFELIGPGLHEPAQLSAPNIKLLGQKTVDEFYALSASWDVGILPFKANRITFSLDPIKYYQYLAAGLKIVSSDVHNLRGAPLTLTYSAENSLMRMLRRSLAAPITHAERETVINYLGHVTWELRAAETLRHLGF